MYWALKKLDNFVGKRMPTDHRNLLYLNNHKSRKVTQCMLDIPHYDAIIDHIPGETLDEHTLNQ